MTEPIYTYTINENLELYCYSNTQEEPFLYQPQHPDGSAWIDRADVEAWAEAYLAYLRDSENNEFPSNRS